MEQGEAGSIEAQFNPSELETYRNMYNKFDTNGDGVIQCSEVPNMLRSLNLDPSEKNINDTMKQADTNKNGSIEWEEFLASILADRAEKPDKPKAEYLADAFKFFDADKDGKLSKTEFQQIMQNCGEPLEPHELEGLMRLGDTDGDGFLSCDEFVRVLCSADDSQQ